MGGGGAWVAAKGGYTTPACACPAQRCIGSEGDPARVARSIGKGGGGGIQNGLGVMICWLQTPFGDSGSTGGSGQAASYQHAALGGQGPGHGLVATITSTEVGWGSEAKKKFCVSKIDIQFRAPLIVFFCSPRKHFLMFVGGWVGQAEEPRQPSPPPPPSNGQPAMAGAIQPLPMRSPVPPLR